MAVALLARDVLRAREIVGLGPAMRPAGIRAVDRERRAGAAEAGRPPCSPCPCTARARAAPRPRAKRRRTHSRTRRTCRSRARRPHSSRWRWKSESQTRRRHAARRAKRMDNPRQPKPRRDGMAKHLNGAKRVHRGAHRDQRLGRVDIGQRGRVLDRHLGDRFGIAADQMARADIAFAPPSGRGRSAAPTAPDCRACPRSSGPPPARRAPDRTPRSAGRSASRSTCGMSPRQTIAPSASAGTAAMPAFSEVESPSAKSGLCTKRHRQAGERALDALASGGR